LKTRQTKFWIQAALIAAIYATLTIVLGSFGYGPIQFRIAEALTILPALTPAGIPGLFVGCMVANILGPYGMLDMILGGGATLIAPFCLTNFENARFCATSVLVNAVVIGAMLLHVPMSLVLACGNGGLTAGQLLCFGLSAVEDFK
jgi:uncharacterized membrane protein